MARREGLHRVVCVLVLGLFLLAEGLLGIQEAPATRDTDPAPTVGRLKGQFAVSDVGKFEYEMPLPVPPGTAGMFPALGLQFSAGKGDGVVGHGFYVTGMSMIQRCPRTFYQDHWVRPVECVLPTFCYYVLA